MALEFTDPRLSMVTAIRGLPTTNPANSLLYASARESFRRASFICTAFGDLDGHVAEIRILGRYAIARLTKDTRVKLPSVEAIRIAARAKVPMQLSRLSDLYVTLLAIVECKEWKGKLSRRFFENDQADRLLPVFRRAVENWPKGSIVPSLHHAYPHDIAALRRSLAIADGLIEAFSEQLFSSRQQSHFPEADTRGIVRHLELVSRLANQFKQSFRQDGGEDAGHGTANQGALGERGRQGGASASGQWSLNRAS